MEKFPPVLREGLSHRSAGTTATVAFSESQERRAERERESVHKSISFSVALSLSLSLALALSLSLSLSLSFVFSVKKREGRAESTWRVLLSVLTSFVAQLSKSGERTTSEQRSSRISSDRSSETLRVFWCFLVFFGVFWCFLVFFGVFGGLAAGSLAMP